MLRVGPPDPELHRRTWVIHDDRQASHRDPERAGRDDDVRVLEPGRPHDSADREPVAHRVDHRTGRGPRRAHDDEPDGGDLGVAEGVEHLER